jgi:hypothetical protein
MMGLDGGRLNIAACALGAAQIGARQGARYMHERKAFGKPLADFQALQFKLADMETELQAARTFLRQAAWKLDNKTPDATKFCAMAKRFVTDTGFRVANEALQIHGGYGYLADYGVEKIVRDLRVHQILEGTNEIMRVIVRELENRHAGMRGRAGARCRRNAAFGACAGSARRVSRSDRLPDECVGCDPGRFCRFFIPEAEWPGLTEALIETGDWSAVAALARDPDDGPHHGHTGSCGRAFRC